MSDENEALTGRKVFFLYPHSVMQEQLVEIIFQAEYEVYLVRDHAKMRGVLAQFPASILFINIDERIHGLDWSGYVQQLMGDAATASVRIGILSYNEDPELARHYLMELAVPCGFVRLKLGLKESARILIQALEANEARGKRRHVRATIPNEMRITFNIKQDRLYTTGRIRDISVAGMACYFDSEVTPAVGDAFPDIQLSLRGQIARVSGSVAGARDTNEGRLYVMVFRSPESSDVKRKIQAFVSGLLQTQMDHLLASG